MNKIHWNKKPTGMMNERLQDLAVDAITKFVDDKTN